ncbi:uncharacterized protein LOC100830427 [Brachypodium distachyon]|uniref:Uncharacterized protein n=1 Tax=Brachypodium distachyon TaxID=15368 RepID=I1IDH3_BRADI|nr:uncharacterized protein LOC100830427 [Brachypodium distachyon]KQK01158.1 hypothetical protein BRADI_3g54150v3 [Brachypodium distachyon]|eukprot:XP_003570304.1 uncharacterized protein LOC100830427 [Brachypodium distachyon]
MPPRRKRRGAAPTAKQQQPAPPGADAPLEEQLRWSIHQEVERRKAAIRAIQVAETESVLSRLRLVRSYISKEQEETCALQFFQENLPNLSVVRNEKEDELELKWKDFDDQIIGDERDDKISRASIPAATGFQFSADSVQKNFKEITGFDFNNFTWNDLPEGHMTGAANSLETPGAMSSRLSFGMTPKTVRLPKPGEMLLSVHGSPLGMYKEDNLAAITESANASGDAAS